MSINSISEFNTNIKNSKSFVVTGLTTFLRLFLLNEIVKTEKKVLFITSTEQSALKYQSDLYSFFNKQSSIFPYQNSSMYEIIPSNIYDYSSQVNLLLNPQDIIIVPVKTLLEKFPSKSFFIKNKLSLKIGDNISQKELLEKLTNLGYKRSTMVNDISEFSIRGDIADIYTLKENPVRIEFWGDEIVDIRFFDRETQKSIEKIKTIDILPVYKFILPQKTPNDFPKELLDKLTEEKYFEGIEVYQSYFNNDFETIFDYLDNYVLVFDEKSEISSKYQFIEENYNKQIEENTKTELIYPLKDINHIPYNDFASKIAKFPRVEFNNFIDSEFDEVLDFNAQVIKNFNANIEEIADFIKKHAGYKIIIATDYKDRVKDILAQYDIFNVEYVGNISANGTIIEDLKYLIITDRELFNKRNKEVTSTKRTAYKEKAEYIESINDIKEGEYVVHSVHGVGIYLGLTQQELDGQLKDYLTIEYA